MNCLGAGLLALIACLGNPDPQIRDKIAFERLSTALRSGSVDRDTLAAAKTALLKLAGAPDPAGFQQPFAILTLAEVARTDRVAPWMTAEERDELVTVAARYLAGITDYRAYNDQEGFRHGVAHGADFALQLALNPAISKAHLDRLLAAIAVQVAPKREDVAYWAGEPDRLARAVIFIAQRALHADAEWQAWFNGVMEPKPLASWSAAFGSEIGIRKRHNTRAFLLSVLATAATTENPGVRQLAGPARDALKLVP